MNRKAFSSVLLLLILVAACGAFWQRQLLKDKYVVATAQQQTEGMEVGQEISLTGNGMFLYKASRPEIQQADQFSASCKDVAHEHSIVLGCYTKQRLYVYNVTDKRLQGVKQVTAAHELLHAAYERLSASERNDLNSLLNSTANSIEDQRFKDTLAEYRRTEPGQVENEIHSILGTEIEVLPSRLEEHYKKYFSDRQKVVKYAKQYEETFTNLDTQIKQYDEELTSLRQQKNELDSSLKAQQLDIETENTRLDRLRGSDPAQYNQLVPVYNAKIRAFNADINRSKRIVAQYNSLVEKRNALATTQNDLVKQLDSDYQPLE